MSLCTTREDRTRQLHLERVTLCHFTRVANCNFITYQLKYKVEYKVTTTQRRQNVSIKQQIQSQGSDHEILNLVQCDNKPSIVKQYQLTRAYRGILSQRRRLNRMLSR